jgi:hypothetical protein
MKMLAGHGLEHYMPFATSDEDNAKLDLVQQQITKLDLMLKNGDPRQVPGASRRMSTALMAMFVIASFQQHRMVVRLVQKLS